MEQQLPTLPGPITIDAIRQGRPIVMSVAQRLDRARVALIHAQACAELVLRQHDDSLDTPARSHIESSELAEGARAAVMKAAAEIWWLSRLEAIAAIEAPDDDQRKAFERWQQATATAGAR